MLPKICFRCNVARNREYFVRFDKNGKKMVFFRYCNFCYYNVCDTRKWWKCYNENGRKTYPPFIKNKKT